MSERSCLICGISKAEVVAVRNREGYTLGCGIESNTEAGFDYEELSPRHRWAPWKDSDLADMGLKPEAFDKCRASTLMDIQYARCEDRVAGHNLATADEPDFGIKAGMCWDCGLTPTIGGETHE